MIGRQLRALRRARGLSQKALAAQAGLSPSAVGMYEQDRRQPSLATLTRLARALGATPAQLLTPPSPPCAAPPDEAETDRALMSEALRLAQEAAANGETPVGCVVAREGVIVGRGRNRREGRRCALAHAELEAIAEACRTLGGWRLWQCTLYVTLEPCPMCAGAILNARIPRVVYGAADPKAGSCGSVCDLFCMAYNHRPRAEQGLLADESAALLRGFFRDLRSKKREKTKKQEKL